MVLPAALGHISLCENQFCIYDLDSSGFGCCSSCLTHSIWSLAFSFSVMSLCICHLLCKPKKKFLCLSVNIRKIFGVQLAACQQIGIEYLAVAFQIA